MYGHVHPSISFLRVPTVLPTVLSFPPTLLIVCKDPLQHEEQKLDTHVI